MMMRAFLIGLLLMLVAPAARADVLIFAAASLKEPVDLMAARFEDVTVSYGGSGALARQVGFGAPADIVLLANTDWMDVLVTDGHVQPETVVDFASNRLVLAGPAAMAPVALQPEALRMALGEGRLALGLTDAVPAGIYARAALENLGLWDELQGQLAEVDNVRNALALIARGQTPLGIVYQTDIRISPQVHAVALFPAETHPPIRYQAALTQTADPGAKEVMAFINGPEGQAILADSGFLPPVDIAVDVSK